MNRKICISVSFVMVLALLLCSCAADPENSLTQADQADLSVQSEQTDSLVQPDQTEQKETLEAYTNFKDSIYRDGEFVIHGVQWDVKEMELVPTLYGLKDVELNDPAHLYVDTMNGQHSATPREAIFYQDIEALNHLKFERSYNFDAKSGELVLCGVSSAGTTDDLSFEEWKNAVIAMAETIYSLTDSDAMDQDEKLQAVKTAESSENVSYTADFHLGDKVGNLYGSWGTHGDISLYTIFFSVTRQ